MVLHGILNTPNFSDLDETPPKNHFNIGEICVQSLRNTFWYTLLKTCFVSFGSIYGGKQFFTNYKIKIFFLMPSLTLTYNGVEGGFDGTNFTYIRSQIGRVGQTWLGPIS